MTDLITVTGVVGSDPRSIITSQGLPITSFRLASSRRYLNRATGSWEDAGTNWYSVSAFRRLAFNTNASLRKGERVIVRGRLKQRPWESGDKSGVALEIEADAVGHDLSWGITQLHRLDQPADGAYAANADPAYAARGEQTSSVGEGSAGGAVGPEDPFEGDAQDQAGSAAEGGRALSEDEDLEDFAVLELGDSGDEDLDDLEDLDDPDGEE